MPDQPSLTHPIQFQGDGQLNDPLSNLSGFPTNISAVMQMRKSSWSPTSLGATEQSYVGILSDIKLLANFCGDNFYSYTIDEMEDQKFKINISLPWDIITNEDNLAPEEAFWEFTPTAVSRNIFDAGIYNVNSSGNQSAYRYFLPVQIQSDIMKAIKNNEQTYSISNVNWASQPGLAVLANLYFNFLRAGTDTIEYYTQVAKRTAVYSLTDPNAYDNFLNTTNANYSYQSIILSGNDLIKYFEMPENYQPAVLPCYSRPKTNESAPWFDPVTIQVYGGYRLKPPIINFLSTTKISLVQEAVFDEWIQNFYQLYSNISDFPNIGGDNPYGP